MKSKLVWFTLPTLIAALAVAPGCGSTDDDGDKACTTIAAISVSVKVVDGLGKPVTDATVKYSVDGGTLKSCDPISSSSGDFSCGIEEKGTFVITATSGANSGTATVTVTSDECHVMGKNATITIGSAT